MKFQAFQRSNYAYEALLKIYLCLFFALIFVVVVYQSQNLVNLFFLRKVSICFECVDRNMYLIVWPIMPQKRIIYINFVQLVSSNNWKHSRNSLSILCVFFSCLYLKDQYVKNVWFFYRFCLSRVNLFDSFFSYLI